MRVSTTMRPHEEIDVDEAEYLDLQRQGLLVEDTDSKQPADTSGDSTASTSDDNPVTTTTTEQPATDRSGTKKTRS